MTKNFWVISTYVFLACAILSPAMAASTEDRILRGNQRVQEKDYKSAVKEYEGALKVDPDNAKANLLLGLTFAITGEFDKAIEYTQKSLKREPSYAGYNNLGLIYANQNQFEKSIEAYEKAIGENPTSYRTWYQLGLVHSANLGFQKAIECFQKVLELNPRFSDAYLGLGSSYYWAGDKTKALEQVNQLKTLKLMDKAAALEKWVEVKELKKSGGST